MVRTRVGYAGGTTPEPAYHHLGDHVEVVQIDYNPLAVSLTQLIDTFWRSHRPRLRVHSRQYSSLVLCENKEDLDLAILSKAEYECRLGAVQTETSLIEHFYLAEGYHQKYYLRRLPKIFQEVEAKYKTLPQLLRSTAVSRLNGYVGGFGTPAKLELELPTFGLSQGAEQRLREQVASF
ncbi:MAG: Peptide methionine sulfoxide reductase MsrA [Firmicutes bacterium]|nr:Peptide methionine sulfoxide reductase MsrA [Bacillota bacterium]